MLGAAGEGLDYKAMGSIFSGLVQCGAWGCFDEFNRIEAEVLSVVSSQIRQIQEALKNGLTRFPFEGDCFSLYFHCLLYLPDLLIGLPCTNIIVSGNGMPLQGVNTVCL